MRTLWRVFIVAAVLFFLLNAAGMAISAMDKKKQQETYKELDLFADALAFIQSQYVEEVSPRALMYGALSGMVAGLDPHSQFMTPQEYEELKVDTEGKFGGIGVEITMKDDLVTVITPIEGAPAWEAGLATGDRIVKIDDAVTKNFTLNEAVRKLRGEPGTDVALVVWREKEGRLHSFKIRRSLIDIKDIKEAKILEADIAYIKLVEFREDTPKEMDRALKDLKAQGARSLILDLRNNPGGLLDRAVEVCERFLEPGAAVVSIKGRDARQDVEFRSRFKTPDTEMEMVLLVNDGSASGSEIVAGALQDHQRAVVLGTKTFGKGSVQTVVPLSDGSAIKLTTSHYFTPLGRSIHEKGITPDISVEDEGPSEPTSPDEETERAKEEIFEKVVEGKPDDPHAALQRIYLDDPALARAVDLLKGLRIYKNLKPRHE